MTPRLEHLILVVMALCSCSGEVSDPTASPTVTIVSGDDQSGTVGQPLPHPLVVRVARGRAGVPGITVRWLVAAGAGSVSETHVATNQGGEASVRWTPGPAGTAQEVIAEVSDSLLPFIALTFTATVAGAATRLAPVSGDDQTGAAGQPLGSSLVVRATTDDGAGIIGVPVGWSMTAGGGSLSAASTPTDVEGYATVTWTLGRTAMHQAVSATVPELTGSPLTFRAVAMGLLAWVVERLANQGPDTLMAIWGSSASDVFAVGTGGTILHYDGSAWQTQSSGKSLTLRGVWGTSPTNVFVVGDSGTILQYDGSGWTSRFSDSTFSVRGIWGSQASDVFAVGFSYRGGAVLHYDGTGWSIADPPQAVGLRAVWGSSGNDVFAVGAFSTIRHYDGTVWSYQDGVGAQLFAVWGTGPTDVFAVGHFMGRDVSGTILHYDGASWVDVLRQPRHLRGVWGSSSTDVVAVGEHGALLHYDGTGWNVELEGIGEPLKAVWGSSPTNLWVVGSGGLILRGTR